MGTFSYSGDPSTSLNDEVRFLLGDTTEEGAEFTDEEIDYLVVKGISADGAAIYGAQSLVSRYAGLVDKTVGPLKISYSQRQTHYVTLLGELRSGRRFIPVPVSTGTSWTEREIADEDDDRIPESFHIGMDGHDAGLRGRRGNYPLTSD